MPQKIALLDQLTINQMAAGEVIENPASVVKELVDNAIDGAATSISIEIVEGGRQLIRIVDDGCGMCAEDAELSFQRHATSKVRSIDDLMQATTLGFRGEALPSIASIAKVVLISSETGKEGTLLCIEGGKIVHRGSCARDRGTTLEVRQLFYNVPVRRKFQKSPRHDAQEVRRIVTDLAMAHPHISFSLISNQELLFQVQGELRSPLDSFLRRARALFGEEYLDQFLPISISEEGISLLAAFSMPQNTRVNRSGQHLFVNRRAVQLPRLSFAVQQGYGTSLPERRHPLWLLHLFLPEELVDPNVHPQKLTLRLRTEERIHSLVMQAVQRALAQRPPSPIQSQELLAEPTELLQNEAEMLSQAVFQTPRSPTSPPHRRSEVLLSQPIYTAKEPFTPPNKQFQELLWNQIIREEEVDPLRPEWRQRLHVATPQETTTNHIPTLSMSTLAETSDLSCSPDSALLNQLLIGTIPGYLLLDGTLAATLPTLPTQVSSGILFIDAARLAARIQFEEERATLDEGPNIVQLLTIPHLWKGSHNDLKIIEENLEILATLGFRGHRSTQDPDSFAITAIPGFLATSNLDDLIDELFENLLQGAARHTITYSQWREKLLAKSINHRHPHSQTPIPREEALHLLNAFTKYNALWSCPEGSPLLIAIDANELSKRFDTTFSKN